jgi:nicotinamidase-related amidase
MDRYTEPDFRGMALITIDTQCDFLDGQPFEIAGTSDILPRMRKLVEAFRRASLPIFNMVRLYKEDGSNVDLCRRDIVERGASIARPGTTGCQLAKELLPKQGIALDENLLLDGGVDVLGPNEWAIYKPRWGAFYRTPLEQHLAGLQVTSLAFAGCNFPNCPRASIYEASERDFRIVLVEDAISGLYPRGSQEMHNIGVTLMTTDQVVAAVSALAPG